MGAGAVTELSARSVGSPNRSWPHSFAQTAPAYMLQDPSINTTPISQSCHLAKHCMKNALSPVPLLFDALIARPAPAPDPCPCPSARPRRTTTTRCSARWTRGPSSPSSAPACGCWTRSGATRGDSATKSAARGRAAWQSEGSGRGRVARIVKGGGGVVASAVQED